MVAQDVLHASLVTASVAGGSAAGVGVGMAVAILNSNVVACTEEGSALSANGDITVYAYAGSPSLTDDALSEDDKAANDFLNREENGDFAISDLTIHAISVSGAIGGTAGVGVAVAVVTLGRTPLLPSAVALKMRRPSPSAPSATMRISLRPRSLWAAVLWASMRAPPR